MRMGRLSQAAVPDLSRMFVELCRRERATILRMDTREHHRQSDRLMEIAEEIKSRGEEGRKALLSLLDHDDENVRLWAASHSLAFAPDIAVPALEDLVALGDRERDGELRHDVVSIALSAERMLYNWREERGLLTPEEAAWLEPMSRRQR